MYQQVKTKFIDSKKQRDEEVALLASVCICLELPYDDETNLSPTIPDTIRSKQTILMMSRDSPNRTMPNIATPIAPIPVHTAYAVPTGIVFMATDSKQKLMAIAEIVRSEGNSFVNPSVYLSPIAHPHSNKPATTK